MCGLRDLIGYENHYMIQGTLLSQIQLFFYKIQLEEKKVDTCANNITVVPEFITKISSFTK